MFNSIEHPEHRKWFGRVAALQGGLDALIEIIWHEVQLQVDQFIFQVPTISVCKYIADFKFGCPRMWNIPDLFPSQNLKKFPDGILMLAEAKERLLPLPLQFQDVLGIHLSSLKLIEIHLN